jgi:hypothetical protein
MLDRRGGADSKGRGRQRPASRNRESKDSRDDVDVDS